jgi:hypothetical protein
MLKFDENKATPLGGRGPNGFARHCVPCTDSHGFFIFALSVSIRSIRVIRVRRITKKFSKFCLSLVGLALQ